MHISDCSVKVAHHGGLPPATLRLLACRSSMTCCYSHPDLGSMPLSPLLKIFF